MSCLLIFFYRSQEPSLYRCIIPQIVPCRGKTIFFPASFSIDLSYSDLFLFRLIFPLISLLINLKKLGNTQDQNRFFIIRWQKHIFVTIWTNFYYHSISFFHCFASSFCFDCNHAFLSLKKTATENVLLTEKKTEWQKFNFLEIDWKL